MPASAEPAPSRRILLVVPHPRQRAYLEAALARYGLDVSAVQDAAEARALLARDIHYDAVVADYDVVESLHKESTWKLPLVLMHRADALRDEDLSYLPYRVAKPFLPRDVMAVLHRAWRGDVADRAVVAQEPVHTAPKATVLLVEDVAMNRTLVRKVIQNTMPQVHLVECVHGQEAVDWCARHHADLILMDVQMPVLDGVDATLRIRELPAYAGTPIIALTAGVVQEERERCKAAGMVDFLPKPFEMATFRATLERYLPVTPSEAEPASTASGLADLVELLGGDDELAMSLAKEALVELDGAYRDLAGGSPAITSARAHELKGMAANLRFNDLAACWNEIEQGILSGRPPDGSVFTQIEAGLAQLRAIVAPSFLGSL